MRRPHAFALLLVSTMIAGCAVFGAPETERRHPSEQARQPAAPVPQPAQLTEDPEGPKEAYAFVSQLLEERVQRRPLDRYLAPGVQIAPSPGSLNLRQYRVERDPNNSANSREYTFKVQGFWDQSGQLSQTTWERFTVVKRNDAYMVTATESLPGTVAFRIKDKGNLVYETESGQFDALVIDRELPNEVQPHGAPAEARFGPGRELRGVSISPDGHQAAFLTTAGHGLLGILDLGPASSSSAKRIVALDLFYGGGGRDLVWSLDGKQLAVSVNMPKGNVALFVGYLDGTKTEVIVPGDPTDLRWLQNNVLRFRIDSLQWEYDPVKGKASLMSN